MQHHDHAGLGTVLYECFLSLSIIAAACNVRSHFHHHADEDYFLSHTTCVESRIVGKT